jgi:hypothetical protein
VVRLRRLWGAIRDDVLVWSGILLVAFALAQYSVPVAVGLIGVGLLVDGLVGRRPG